MRIWLFGVVTLCACCNMYCECYSVKNTVEIIMKNQFFQAELGLMIPNLSEGHFEKSGIIQPNTTWKNWIYSVISTLFFTLYSTCYNRLCIVFGSTLLIELMLHQMCIEGINK
jgi:hypothetical protein